MDLEDRNLHQAKILKLGKIMNEKMSKRRIQIRDLQKQEIEEKQERRLLIRLRIKKVKKQEWRGVSSTTWLSTHSLMKDSARSYQWLQTVHYHG